MLPAAARPLGGLAPLLLLLLLLLPIADPRSPRDSPFGAQANAAAGGGSARRGTEPGFGGDNAVSFLGPGRKPLRGGGSGGGGSSISFPEAASGSVSRAVSNEMHSRLDSAAFRRRYERQFELSNDLEMNISASSSIVNDDNRHKREDQLTNPCERFEIGDPVKQEFYSPLYPDPYPKNISCYKVLEADPGKVLKVEFRDNFELEDQEDCKYDYLAVHDGKYGYSRLLGQFCRAFPFPEITSSSRYLWLAFHSDNSIQGSGFRAVWSMIPRPAVKTPEAEECVLNVTNAVEYEINTSEIADRKRTAAEQGTELDCIWNITVPDGWKIQLTFPQFHLDKPNECDINYVQVYDKEPAKINNPTINGFFCGSIAELVTSRGNEAYLRFFATKAAINSSFEAIMTAVRDKENKDKGCNDDEFDCQDSCISETLKCNSRPNCRYRFDEDADVCETEKSGLNVNSEHVIIILVVFTLLMSGLCFTFIFNCMKKLIRDHRIIKEHIRQSRENRLDEIGRKVTPCSMTEPCKEIDDDHRHSISPSLEVLANPKELVSPITIIGRDYVKERSLRLSADLSDIHQSNNVSNATQERLQESNEEREMRDTECQTRESLFDVGYILKPSAHPAFSTFGLRSPESSRKQSFDYHPDHHYHHHAHPHYHPQTYTYHHHHHHTHQQIGDSNISIPSEKIQNSPRSRRCSVCHPSDDSSSKLCSRHSLTPIVPAPHGWSAHESTYSPEDLASLQRFGTGSPQKIVETDLHEHMNPSLDDFSPKFMTRHRTVGSGENYGFIYGTEEKDKSDRTASSGSSSQRSIGAKPVKCPQVADSRFKTEAIIEVDQKRPFSIESTKSAPDVIATH